MKMKYVGNMVFIATMIAFLSGLGSSCALPSAPSDRHAIVIGIAAYQNVNQLTYPPADAAAMKTLLTNTGWSVDSSLIDGAATKAAIKTAIANLAKASGVSSTVLVYYSGHGTTISGEAYIAPVDTAASLNTASLISTDELHAWLKALPSSNRLLILDSCDSGGFADSGTSMDSAPPNYGSTAPYNGLAPLDQGFDAGLIPTALNNAGALLSRAFTIRADPGILTIAAAGAEEQSYDDSQHLHGAFTYYLLAAGSDAAADTDGNKLVTAVEAYTYATNMIKTNWNATWGSTVDGGMYMDFLPRISGGSGDIVLYDKR
jgi:uncharacterized caspase-like protein